MKVTVITCLLAKRDMNVNSGDDYKFKWLKLGLNFLLTINRLLKAK